MSGTDRSPCSYCLGLVDEMSDLIFAFANAVAIMREESVVKA